MHPLLLTKGKKTPQRRELKLADPPPFPSIDMTEADCIFSATFLTTKGPQKKISLIQLGNFGNLGGSMNLESPVVQ